MARCEIQLETDTVAVHYAIGRLVALHGRLDTRLIHPDDLQLIEKYLAEPLRACLCGDLQIQGGVALLHVVPAPEFLALVGRLEALVTK